MDLVQSAFRFPTTPLLRRHPHRPLTPLRRLRFTIRSSLPFPEQTARYHRELRAAVDAVERACRLCVDVNKSLLSNDGRILEKNDQTPVTVADFGVQALISLELSKLFPSIPLVAEEDSAFLRSNSLVNSVVNEVTDKSSFGDKQLTEADVLEAIDRGAKDAFSFGPKPATYWVLDPIDGTRGFVRGGDALYVVGLALVVEREIVLGVMGCPNWQQDNSGNFMPEALESGRTISRSGIIMVAHVGCGTWARQLSGMLSSTTKISNSWTRCSVNNCCLVHEARFCISDSQTWEAYPLFPLFNATTDAESVNDKQVLLLPTCCGSLCKYLMVASGRASVFVLHTRAQTMIKVWDHAVGMICVHEAGGKVTDWRGSELDLAADQVERRIIFPSGGVLVTNSSLHSQLLELISSGKLVV
ncbi:PAP-specific phosphatase precursor [Actinidia chinensis var. chinensis]|uniref:PAP-specific phosphatase n=1 Tax=Actinidia chinensis var. chinensis TaxID=1590841 RepID=A0A2R6QLM7_ACTCC|nr:PAP-specific phosphatase precursor [Actinidia chinensis var. chinensis]